MGSAWRPRVIHVSDRRLARFWRKARSMAPLKVSRRTPVVGLASATLPNTGFWAEVETGIVELALDEDELWPQSTAGKCRCRQGLEESGKRHIVFITN